MSTETTLPATAAREPGAGADSRADARPSRPRIPGHWVLRRLLQLPLSLLVFSVFVFFFAKLIPGDPLAASSTFLSAEQVDSVKDSLGMNDPLPVQLGTYLLRMVTFDLGTGISDGTSIADQFAQRLPISLQLTVLGLGATLLVSVALAFVGSLHPTSPIGRVIRWFGRSAGAFPDFTLGVLFIFVFYSLIRMAPAPLGPIDPLLSMPPRITGFPLIDAVLTGDSAALGSLLAHLWLPVLVIVFAYTPMLLKVLLVSMDTALSAPHTLFMVAVGMRPRDVRWSMLKHSTPTTVANLGNLTVMVLGGTIVIEQLFSLGGLGQYAVQAVQSADYVIVQSFLVVYAAICLVVFLICDLVIALVDRRRSLGVTR
ncbi:ABC transporter permease [Herbiconiux moechotypicola]|uniref:ABC transporter permease n=1 Tax=Herbiconiux moechotypicola TaxID=637393 RepID=A0ABN3DPI7_9MICO|nr:ABC transporter permease [Herbiconiux moechotypicola]MCS5731681.1 ABC transporter permease [Herbiconiux moechotypicola]